MGNDKRRLKIDFDALEDAVDNSFYELSYYLDLETGEVILVTEDTRDQLDSITDRTGMEAIEAVNEAIQNEMIPDWQRESLHEAALVEFDRNNRFVQVPPADSRDGYADMEAFIETVSQPRLQERLQTAIQGKGAFRRFKDVLESAPEERERWFEYRDKRLRQRVLDWLETEDIEPIT